jgi:hypothetical protein
MKDLELTARGKAAFGALCALCCGVPMMVSVGVVSTGIAVTVGASIASAIAVVTMAYLVSRHGAVGVPATTRHLLTSSGAALSALGLWLASTSSGAAATVVSLGLASLATAALLALAAGHTEQSPIS